MLTGGTCEIRQGMSTRRYREKAAHRPVKQRKQQNQAAWEDDKKSEPRRVKGWRFRGTNKLGGFSFLFSKEHGTDENSTEAAFKHGHVSCSTLSDCFLFFNTLFTPLCPVQMLTLHSFHPFGSLIIVFLPVSFCFLGQEADKVCCSER